MNISGPSLNTTDTNDTVALNSIPLNSRCPLSNECVCEHDRSPGHGVRSVHDPPIREQSGFLVDGAALPGGRDAERRSARRTTLRRRLVSHGTRLGADSYEPGDEITISGATNVNSSTDYTVQGIVGDNLYLSPALPSNAIPPNATVNDDDVTVAPANFTPEVEAVNLTLTVTGAGSSISGAIYAYQLEGSTQNGNITLQNVNVFSGVGPLYVGPLDAGTGTIQLDANSPIEGNGYLTAVRWTWRPPGAATASVFPASRSIPRSTEN